MTAGLTPEQTALLGRAGLTPAQRGLLEQHYCERGHRVDGVNYPTPEGICPLCAWPEIRDDFDHFQRLLAEQSVQPRAELHPSLTAM
jgi:hypothetical protein